MGERLLSLASRASRTPLPAQARWSTRVSLGTRIRNARVAAGITESELAEGLTTTAYLSRIETSERRPSATLLGDLAGRIGVRVSELTRGDIAAAEGLRFELAHADLLLATSRYDDAARVGHDLAEVASRIGSPEVANEARIVRASALASIGQRRKALRLVRPLSAGPTSLTAMVAGARLHLMLSDFAGVITIGQRVGERVVAKEQLSGPEAADLALSVCRAHQALGRPADARQVARLVLRHLGPESVEEWTPAIAATLAVSYRSFDAAVRNIERAVAGLAAAKLLADCDDLRRIAERDAAHDGERIR